MAQKTILFNELGVEERMNLYNSVIGVIRKDTGADVANFYYNEAYTSTYIYDIYDTAIFVTKDRLSAPPHFKRRSWNDLCDNALYDIKIVGKSEDTLKAVHKLGLEKYLKD